MITTIPSLFKIALFAVFSEHFPSISVKTFLVFSQEIQFEWENWYNIPWAYASTAKNRAFMKDESESLLTLHLGGFLLAQKFGVGTTFIFLFIDRNPRYAPDHHHRHNKYLPSTWFSCFPAFPYLLFFLRFLKTNYNQKPVKGGKAECKVIF